MSSIGLENGFARISNKLLEVIYGTNFNATQLKIVLCVIRYTYGFNRKSHKLSRSFISKATGISKRYVSDELNKLIESKVLIVMQEYTVINSRELKLNKNYKEWVGYRTILHQGNNTTPGEELFTTPGEELFTTPGEELFTQERQIKDKLKTIYSLEFENFYNIYPRPTEKKRTYTNWGKRIKEYSPEEIIKAAKNYKAKVEAEKTDKQYIKTSANFLGRDKFFEDYLNIEQPEEIKPNPEYIRMKELLNGGSGTGL